MKDLLESFQAQVGTTYQGSLDKAHEIMAWYSDGLISRQNAIHRLWDAHDDALGLLPHAKADYYEVEAAISDRDPVLYP